MKTFAFSLLLLTIAFGSGTYNAYSQDSIVSIPDTTFLYALIEEGLDTDGDSLISYKEAEAVNTIGIGSGQIDCTYPVSLKGIEAFVNLDTLCCEYYCLTPIDLSNNTALRYLSFIGCGLDTINVSNNTALITLSLGGGIGGVNNLRNLDISNNTALKVLNCEGNKISSLDVSNNTALTVLGCGGNHLMSSLDLSNNINLEILCCGPNELMSSLDLSNNINLVEIDLRWMEKLTEVCLWQTPPPFGVTINIDNSPNVRFTSECTTGLNEYLQNNISLYPNPSNDLLIIETNNPGQHTIEITSLNGQLLYSTKKEGTTLQIDLSTFHKGLYFITVRSRYQVWTEKIIKL